MLLHRFLSVARPITAMINRRPFATVAVASAAALAVAGLNVGWGDLLLRPDQRGRWDFEHERYADAAVAFRDPAWRAAALFRDGVFKEAAQIYGGRDTAESAYNQGNALVMLGQYDDAVGRYDRALALRPGWADAVTNRRIAQLRAERLKTQGGETGSTDSKPDEIVFDRNKKSNAGKDEKIAGGEPMSDDAVRALWLRRVQTKPADFLKAKFAYELAGAPASGGNRGAP